MTFDCLDAPAATAHAEAQGAEMQSAANAPSYSPTGSRYGDQRGFNFSALGITAAVHVALGLALLGLGAHAAKSKPPRLVTVNLSLPPPAPPPSPQKTTPQKLPITVQQPVVQAPVVPQPPIALSPVQVDAPIAPPVVDVSPPAPPAPPAPPSVITSNSLGTRMISGNPPRYPMDSRRKHEQGTVQLLIILGVDGAVESISVSRSSGFPQLDNAALSAVRRWRWSPTMRDGSPVKVRGVVEIPFVLKSSE